MIEAIKREEGLLMVEEVPTKQEIEALVEEMGKWSCTMKDEEQLTRAMKALRQMLEKNSQHAIPLLK